MSAACVTTIGVSLPIFFTGLLLVYVFYFLLGWAPSPLGRLDPFVPAAARHWLLPDRQPGRRRTGGVLGEPRAARAARDHAGAVCHGADRAHDPGLDAGVLSSEFIRTARASGLSRLTVLCRYALRNALLPIVTTLGMVFSFLLGSNVLVEKVFAWPGIGSYAIEALVVSDYAPVQGFVLTMAILYVMLNLVDRSALHGDRSPGAPRWLMR